MIHYTTGNKLDVVLDYEDGKERLVGLKPWDGPIIPLPDPVALIATLRECLADVAAQNKRMAG